VCSGQQVPVELRRLRALETLWDNGTVGLLRSLFPRSTWRCLEIGAGTGSIARWLAARCRQIVATEVDLRYLAGTANYVNVEVVLHDVSEGEDFAAGSFDLVHCRAVLAHLPDRDAVLARTERWVAPGGWLVVEEPSIFPVDSSPYPPFLAAMRDYERVMGRWVGSDLRWSRSLPTAFAGIGLIRLGVSASIVTAGDGGPGDEFWNATVEELCSARDGDGLLADPHALAGLLTDPGFADLSLALVSAWGQKPHE
jgi:SAM-dependent methyltransferase